MYIKLSLVLFRKFPRLSIEDMRIGISGQACSCVGRPIPLAGDSSVGRWGQGGDDGDGGGGHDAEGLQDGRSKGELCFNDKICDLGNLSFFAISSSIC